MYKFKIVGEVKFHPSIVRNDWGWRKSSPAGVMFVAVRKDVATGTYDVQTDFVRDGLNDKPYLNLMGDPEEQKVYDTYAEALSAARRITAAYEADPVLA